MKITLKSLYDFDNLINHEFVVNFIILNLFISFVKFSSLIIYLQPKLTNQYFFSSAKHSTTNHHQQWNTFQITIH